MIIKLRRAQSILEYTALVIIVATALSATTFYISRALVVKQRHLAQEMNEANR